MALSLFRQVGSTSVLRQQWQVDGTEVSRINAPHDLVEHLDSALRERRGCS
jgi:hypothetical protein